jgi:hypothetical protein
MPVRWPLRLAIGIPAAWPKMPLSRLRGLRARLAPSVLAELDPADEVGSESVVGMLELGE